jgi:hypothetical protein
MPRLHPNPAELYRQKVMNLAEALNDEHTRLEAAECIRELIEEIRLVPKHGELEIEWKPRRHPLPGASVLLSLLCGKGGVSAGLAKTPPLLVLRCSVFGCQHGDAA